MLVLGIRSIWISTLSLAAQFHAELIIIELDDKLVSLDQKLERLLRARNHSGTVMDLNEYYSLYDADTDAITPDTVKMPLEVSESVPSFGALQKQASFIRRGITI
jgi:hypothetical protein